MNQTTKARILMVDDDPYLLESHRRSLRKHFDVHLAQGGIAALDKLASDGPFQVVVSDIKMPSMTGIDLLARIREEYPDTIRMVLTGFADLEIAISAVNRGDIFRFLTKPCAADDLVYAINAGVEQHDLTQAAQELAIVRRLKKGLEGTLQAFTRLVEFRDPYTAGHMDRVAEISSAIAERMSLPEDQIEGLRLASLVHDIGKIAIPAGILNKPGNLNEAEFALIKAHPLVGAEIFETLDTNWPISSIIMQHHERMDGSGYPHGLKKDQILLESRILAVADVMDAMMTHRPYRQSLGVESTVQYLQSGSEDKLDPEIVKIGIELLREENSIGNIFT